MTDDNDNARGSIKREGQFAVIRLPMSEVHALRVALAECPCRATKSTETAAIRARIAHGLGVLVAHR